MLLVKHSCYFLLCVTPACPDSEDRCVVIVNDMIRSAEQCNPARPMMNAEIWMEYQHESARVTSNFGSELAILTTVMGDH